MTGPLDYPDFTQPVAAIERFTPLSAIPANIANNATVTGIDTSAGASVVLRIVPPNGAVGDRCMLQAIWVTGGQTVDLDTLTFHSVASYASSANSIAWRLPAKGTELQLFYSTTGAGALGIQGTLSTRVFGGDQAINPDGNNQGPMLVRDNLGINAGVTRTFYVPPVARAVTIAAGYAITTGTMTVNGIGTPGATPIASKLDQVAFSPTLGGSVIELAVPGIGLEVQVTNGDAGNHAGTITVWDVS